MVVIIIKFLLCRPIITSQALMAGQISAVNVQPSLLNVLAQASKTVLCSKGHMKLLLASMFTSLSNSCCRPTSGHT